MTAEIFLTVQRAELFFPDTDVLSRKSHAPGGA